MNAARFLQVQRENSADAEIAAKINEAREDARHGWNLRCNVCGNFGANWLPELRPGWGCLAACPEHQAAIEVEQKRHAEAMKKLTAVNFEQPGNWVQDLAERSRRKRR